MNPVKRLGSRSLLLAVALVVPALAADSPKPAATRPAETQPAAAPPQPLTAAEQKAVDAAVASLSADGWKERQAAQDALVSFGESVVPRLRELATKGDDEEVRTRAAAALRQIDDNGQSGPSVITLHLKDATAQDAFAALARQARCEFPTYPANLLSAKDNNNGGPVPGGITVDYDRANFWVVFKDLCQKTGLGPQQYGNDRRMTLSRGTSVSWNGPTVTSGPFLIVANRISRSNAVDLANPANVQTDFSMSLSAFCEPKVRVIGSSYNVKVDEAVDDKGNALTSNEFVYDNMNNGQQWMWNLTARLKYPQDNAGKRIQRLKGSVKFLVQTRSESLDIPDVLAAKNVTQNVGGRRIVLKEVKKNGEQYDVQMSIFRDGLNAQEWNALQYPGYAVRLLDKEGRALTSHGWGGGGGGNEMSYNFNFSKQNFHGGEDGKPGEPHRLVWEIPIETRETNVNFEYKDLPLP
jgi:hypothetical protein